MGALVGSKNFGAEKIDASILAKSYQENYFGQELRYKEASLIESIEKSNLELNIACYNINGMKSNKHKIELVYE